MPVTVRPQPDKVGVNVDRYASSSMCLYDLAELEIENVRSKSWKDRGLDSVVHDSFRDLDDQTCDKKKRIIPYANGFVQGIMRAFQQDLHLVLRPDDVWLAVLNQYMFCLNRPASKYIMSETNHDVHIPGQEDFKIDIHSSPAEETDIQESTARAIEAMKQKYAGNDLTEWLLPDFTTTNDDDRTAAIFVIMSTLRGHFMAWPGRGCGFPSVTLLGEKSD